MVDATRIAGAALSVVQSAANTNAGNIARMADPDAIRETPILSTDANGRVRFGGARLELDRDLLQTHRSLHADEQTRVVETRALEGLVHMITTTDSNKDDLVDLFAKVGVAVDALAKGTVTPKRFLDTCQTFMGELNRVETLIQGKRTDADSQIKSSVDRVNAILEELSRINDLIGATQGITGNNSTLSNARTARQAALLTELTSYMNVRVTSSSGTLKIQTESGSPAILLDSRGSHPLSFTASISTIDATMTKTGGQLFGVMSDTNVDITSSISTGALAGLFSVRDNLMVKESEALGELSRRMAFQLNKVVNAGTSATPRETLTGSVSSLTGATAITVTGNIYITAVDQNGKYIGRYQIPNDGSITTVQDLLDGVNTPALANVTAALTAGGNLQLQGSSANGVYLSIGGDGTISDGTTTTNFSHFFGLQDLFTWTGALSDANISAKLRVNSSFLANPALLPLGALDTSQTTAGKTVVASGDKSTARALTLEFNDGGTVVSFSAAGNLTAQSTTFKTYMVDVFATMVETAKASQADYANSHAAAVTAEEAFKNASGIDPERVLTEMPRLQFIIQALAAIIQSANEAQRDVLSRVI